MYILLLYLLKIYIILSDVYILQFQIYFGVCVTICVTASWVGATHCIKYLYFDKHEISTYSPFSNSSITGHHQHVNI